EAYERADRRFGTEIPEVASGYVGGQGIDNWLICQTLRNAALALLFPEPATRPAGEYELASSWQGECACVSCAPCARCRPDKEEPWPTLKINPRLPPSG